MKKLLASLNTPVRIVVAVGSLIAAAELLIMLVILPIIIPETYWGFADTILLTAIVSPALYFLVFRPMRESEASYRQLVDKSPDIVYRFSSKRGGLFYSEQATRLLGYSLEHLYAHPWLWNESIHHEDAPRIAAIIQQSGEEENFDIEYRIKNARGQWLWFHDRSIWVRKAADGEFIVEGLAMDITARKNAEDKLAESEQHFRAVTESANDAIITGTGAGNIVGWNAAAERLFGYTEAEIIGQPLTLLMPERFRNLHSAGLARVVAGGAPHVIGKTVELAGLRKDGSEFPLEFSLAQWQAADGQFFTAIIRDITERKRIEQAQARLVAILEATPDFVGFADAKDTHIRFINKAGRKMTGLSEDEDVTRFKIADVHPEWANKMLDDEIIPAAIRDGAWVGECAFLNRNNGREIPVMMVLLSHKAPGGEIEFFSTISRDVTERKLAEAKLAEQVDDLRRWHDATIGREMRVLDLKHEVNELLGQAGQPPRYPSAEPDDPQEK
ncbi:MAG: PAS domain-containing protein [Gallionellaceae bacterium]